MEIIERLEFLERLKWLVYSGFALNEKSEWTHKTEKAMIKHSMFETSQHDGWYRLADSFDYFFS